VLARPSPNWNERPAGAVPDMLILHYTGMRDAPGALARLCDPAAAVSAHWLIDEDGTVWRLVDESRRAWHAGLSAWAGRANLNDVSIGIELVNPGHEFGYRPFPEAQMAACVELCRAILARWPIPPRRVLAHADVAPARKQDPGEMFDWRCLARAGIGLSPEPVDAEGVPSSDVVGAALGRFGYPIESAPLSDVILAFQRHFVPEGLGRPFDELAWARLRGLLRVVGEDLRPARPDA
jgi:N-acetylmuramoyl-L-alanine amidase